MYNQIERIRQEKGRVRAVLFARCSTDEQGKNGYTITDQVEYGRYFCQENDIILVGEYVDEGISATLEINKRPALAQLIKDAKAGNWDIVIIKCLDRFFRNVGEYFAAKKELEKAGVTWFSIEEPDLDPADADAAFKINIYLSMSEYEARKASKRVQFNNRMRIKNKQVITGGHCFLFPWIVVGEHRDRHLERDMSQADRLFDILDHYEMFQSKSATLKYHNAKYEPISYNTLTNLLKDTLLYGEYKGVPNYVESSITKERFDKIQDILERNSKQRKDSDRVFIFSGMIKCPICGRNLSGNLQKRDSLKNPHHSYRCNHYRINKICTNTLSFNEKSVEKQLLDNLGQYIEGEILRVTDIKQKETPAVDNTNKIEKLKQEMSRLNNMYRKGNIEEEEYDKDIAIIKNDIAILEAVEKPKERDLSALTKLIESDYRTIYEALDRPHRKAFWRAIIKEFTVDMNRKIVPESIVFF